MGQNVIGTKGRNDMRKISPCSHEEADTCVILRAKDAADEGYQKVLIRTVDSNVIALCICHFSNMELQELWVAYGAGKHFYYLSIHDIVSSLGAEVAMAVSMFHAFTGCDTTSMFAGIHRNYTQK